MTVTMIAEDLMHNRATDGMLQVIKAVKVILAVEISRRREETPGPFLFS
jgi:hypothetical protein